VRLEDRARLVVDPRVLDPRVREEVDDALVEDRIGRLVDDRAPVEALEVDGVDRAGLGERGEELLVP